MNKDINILTYSLMFGNPSLNSTSEALLLGFFVGILHTFKIEFDDEKLHKVNYLFEFHISLTLTLIDEEEI